MKSFWGVVCKIEGHLVERTWQKWNTLNIKYVLISAWADGNLNGCVFGTVLWALYSLIGSGSSLCNPPPIQLLSERINNLGHPCKGPRCFDENISATRAPCVWIRYNAREIYHHGLHVQTDLDGTQKQDIYSIYPLREPCLGRFFSLNQINLIKFC